MNVVHLHYGKDRIKLVGFREQIVFSNKNPLTWCDFAMLKMNYLLFTMSGIYTMTKIALS
jgi:hypothetical protein